MKTPSKTTLPISNINSVVLAAYLADRRPGSTFSAVIYKKMGVERGRGANRKRFGDDTVLDTVVTGFSYTNLCERDLADIESGKITAEKLYEAVVKSGRLDKDDHVPSLQACEKALAEQAESYRRTLAGTNESTTDHVREPVIVDGQRVQGCWVNNGLVDPGKTGVPYLYGLRVARKVLEAAPNGPIPASKSKATVVAKGVLRQKFLRIGRWCQVKLDPSTNYILKLGGEAATLADQKGVKIEENTTVREIYEEGKAA